MRGPRAAQILHDHEVLKDMHQDTLEKIREIDETNGNALLSFFELGGSEDDMSSAILRAIKTKVLALGLSQDPVRLDPA